MLSSHPIFKISAALALCAAIQGLGLNAQPDQPPPEPPPADEIMEERDLPLQGQGPAALKDAPVNISETAGQNIPPSTPEIAASQTSPAESAASESATAPGEMPTSSEAPPSDEMDLDQQSEMPLSDTEFVEALPVEKEPTPEETLLSNSPFLSPLYFMRGSQNARLFSNTSINPVEFRGAVYLNGKWQFSLYDTKDKRGFWVSMDDTAAPYRIISYNEQANSISVDANGMITEIPMSVPSDVPMGIAASPGVIRAAADKNAKTNAKNVQAGKNQNKEKSQSQTKPAAQTQMRATPTAAPSSNNRQNAGSWMGQRRRIQTPVNR